MTAVKHYIETFVPEHYNLFLDIDRGSKTFHGNVAITGEALENQISLHQKNLTISSVLLDNQEVPFAHDHDQETLHLDLPETGQLTLILEFSGQITDNMTGIYPSYYTVDGVNKEVISTQFESHFAREAFPCVDEPEAKATFDFSVKFDQVDGEIALSNMPEINPDLRQETGIWQFATTPRMSTYLLAFALGELHGQTTKTKNGTEVGVFATKAHPLEKTDFALDIAKRVIEFYEDYFGVTYPIPLSYHVALPDFSAGAMENWGLVTYREVYLLADANSTIFSRQSIALVIAHEVAHQWFGNLVTMKWWDDLWLNESFANMMEYLSIDALHPEWKIWESFQAGSVPAALTRDATDGVQSVHMPVHHPDEINTLFDGAIVYAKGSRLMVMLHRWLGDEAFRKGLRSYFDSYQYRNTVGKNLWDALAAASGKDVAGFMDSWLEQPGFPLLTVSLDGDALVLRQEQFFIGEAEDKNRLWKIPLNSTWSGLPDTLETAELRLPGYAKLQAENAGALRFNTQNTAHYLVNYQGQLGADLMADLGSLDVISQQQLLMERRFLAKAGRISYADLLPLLPKLADNESDLINEGVTNVLSDLPLFIEEDSQEEQDFKTFRRNLLSFNYDRLGWDLIAGESSNDANLRQGLLNLMVNSDHKPAQETASAIFQNHKDNLEAIPAHQRTAVLVNEMKTAPSMDLLKSFFEAYVQTTDVRFRYALMAAISWNKSPEGLDYILEQLKDKAVIKPQDLGFWYSNLLSRSFSQDAAWEWAKTNWDWLKDTLGGDMAFEDFVISPGHIFKTPEKLASYKAFYEPQLDDMAISRSIGMGIKEITARVALIEKDKEAVQAALAKLV